MTAATANGILDGTAFTVSAIQRVGEIRLAVPSGDRGLQSAQMRKLIPIPAPTSNGKACPEAAKRLPDTEIIPK